MTLVNNPHFRPPAEADSLILQIDEGCPCNACTFCDMYKGMRHRKRNMDDIQTLIRLEAQQHPDAQRVFLADGDVMRRPFSELQSILVALGENLPRLVRDKQRVLADLDALLSSVDDFA